MVKRRTTDPKRPPEPDPAYAPAVKQAAQALTTRVQEMHTAISDTTFSAIRAVPGLSALGGFNDRLLMFGASMVLMALVAVIQWDRLSLDARDASILGVLPVRHGLVVRAKWIATAGFAGSAALLFNGLPSLIYPIVSVGRLEATWLLVLQLTLLQLGTAMLSGLLGFVAVLTFREVLWALLGAPTFARVTWVSCWARSTWPHTTVRCRRSCGWMPSNA